MHATIYAKSLVACWVLVLLALTPQSLSQQLTTQELLARICDCNRPSRNCHPFDQAAYVQCSACTEPCTAPQDSIVTCETGSLYDYVLQDCVPAANATYLCSEDDDGDTDPFCNVDCFCESKPNGVHPNPYDPFCQSSIQCDSNIDGGLAGVDICSVGQRFHAATQTCVPAANVTCFGAPADSCSDVDCFCEHRAAGLYDNPFDFDAGSAIECGTCGAFVGVWIGAPGFVFDGADFVEPNATNPKPQLCGQINGGVKLGSHVLAQELFSSPPPPPAGRRLKGMDSILGGALDTAMWSVTQPGMDVGGNGPGGGSKGSKCGRSVLATAPANSVQLVPVSGCSSTFRCPTGTPRGALRVVRCRLVQCYGSCSILTSSRNYCTTTTG